MFTELKDEHIDGLYKMLRYCKSDERYFHPHSFEKKQLRKLLDEKGNYFYVLMKRNKIIGYSFLRTFNKYDHPTFGGIIHRDYRKQGHGERLLKFTIFKARAKGFKQILLKVHENNKVAFNLYKKTGFVEKGKEAEQLWMVLKL